MNAARFLLLVGSASWIALCPTAQSTQSSPLDGLVRSGASTAARSISHAQRAFKRVHKGSSDDLLLQSVQNDPEHAVSVARFQHFVGGVPVLGSQMIYQPEIGFLRDRTHSIALSTEPELTAAQALSLAQFYAAGDATVVSAPELGISNRHGQAKLVFTVELNDRQLWIDARTGARVGELPTQLFAGDPREFQFGYAPIRTYNAKNRSIVLAPKDPSGRGNGDYWLGNLARPDLPPTELTRAEYSLIKQGKNEAFNALCQWTNGITGGYLRLNHEKCDLAFDSARMVENHTDPATERASLSANAVLGYFRTQFRRESFDNQAAPLISVVHVGYRMNNAFWDAREKRLIYGAGDGQQYEDFTQGTDVAGHEFTHAVIDQTAKLLPFDESGALNESYADFFGEWIEARRTGKNPDWVFAAQVRKDGMRSLRDPHSVKNGPAHFSEKRLVDQNELCDRSNDYCFVHVNSTIPSHAAYLMTQAIGAEKSQKLIYRTLTTALTQDETFESAALATLQMCGKMYDSQTCDRVLRSYQKVGLLQSPVQRLIAMN